MWPTISCNLVEPPWKKHVFGPPSPHSMLSELNEVLLESPHEMPCYYLPTTLIQGGRGKQDENFYIFRRGPTNLQLMVDWIIGDIHWGYPLGISMIARLKSGSESYMISLNRNYKEKLSALTQNYFSKNSGAFQYSI